jgi:hypothetical protein
MTMSNYSIFYFLRIYSLRLYFPVCLPLLAVVYRVLLYHASKSFSSSHMNGLFYRLAHSRKRTLFLPPACTINVQIHPPPPPPPLPGCTQAAILRSGFCVVLSRFYELQLVSIVLPANMGNISTNTTENGRERYIGIDIVTIS